MGSRGLVCGSNRLALSNLHLFVRKSSERRAFTRTSCSKIDPPDLTRLAQTARISLSPNQVEEFAPKIRQVVDWFGQLQAVDLDSVEPSIRADTEDDNLRNDIPQTFDNREAIIGGIPKYEEPYIRVPKVLSDE